MPDSQPARSQSRSRPVPGVLTLLAALLLLSCSEAASPGAGAACTFRQAVTCTGPGACAGVRVCRDDLSDFGPCSCSDAGANQDAGGRGRAD